MVLVNALGLTLKIIFLKGMDDHDNNKNVDIGS